MGKNAAVAAVNISCYDIDSTTQNMLHHRRMISPGCQGVRSMLALKLVRLIEEHSEELAIGLAEKLQQSDRTNDFCKVSSEGLCLAAAEVYHNLGEWLLQKTETDIAERFIRLGERRAAEGVGLHQFVWALVMSRNHLWQFLQREAFADNVIQLSGKLELQQMLNQFYDRALYYGVLGYKEAKEQERDAQGIGVSVKGAGRGPVVVRTFGEKRRD
jgi:hypothetical protein